MEAIQAENDGDFELAKKFIQENEKILGNFIKYTKMI